MAVVLCEDGASGESDEAAQDIDGEGRLCSLEAARAGEQACTSPRV